MKKKARFAAKVLLLAAAAVGLSMATWKMQDYHKGAQDYSEAAQLAGISKEAFTALGAAENPSGPSGESSGEWEEPSRDSSGSSQETEPGNVSQGEESGSRLEEDDPPVSPSEPEAAPDPYIQALAQIDLNALRLTNPDVTGWIAIPGTDVFYPVMQTDNNQHYLNYTWKNEGSSVGSIFLEATCKPDLTSYNTIVYGHQMMDGSMFGRLSDFGSEGYWREHPSIYIVTDAGVKKYNIFSAFEVGVREIVYRLDLEENKMQQDFVNFCVERSVIDTGIVPKAEDRMLTLSTCTGWGYSTRWVVVAAEDKGE